MFLRSLCRTAVLRKECSKDLNCRLLHYFSFAFQGRLLPTKLCHPVTSRMPLASRRTHDDSSKRPDEVNDIKLMDFNEIVWPNVFKSIKNMFMAFLIRGYYDNQFDSKGFLKGAEQVWYHFLRNYFLNKTVATLEYNAIFSSTFFIFKAVATVSTSISSGDFNSLNGLVTEEVAQCHIFL